LDSAKTDHEPAAALRESLLPDRYRLLDRVAIGGMGSVWVAEDRALGRQVAVKILAEQFASQPLFVKRFEREARTAAALSGHPNVITIYDVGEHDGHPFIVMAYLPGGTIRDRIEAGHVEPGEAVKWLRDAASGLDFAHARGVVHRDVKPQNLLFDGEGRVVVADLGIARAAYEDSLTGSGELLGTASYLSPEQAMGERATPSSDRYSLAIVAYQLLTGSRPFEGESFAEQALQQIEAEPQPPSTHAPELSPEVDAVLLRGLAKDPTRRWETAGALASALGNAVEHGASWKRAARPTPVALSRRSPVRAGTVAATLIAAALFGGLVLVSTGDDGGSGSGKPRDRVARSPAKPRVSGRTGTAARTPPARVTLAGAPPAALNQQGFDLMNSGRYDQAIPLFRRAVAAYPKGSTDLTYAYALYNLGRSLRLVGKPSEAIQYLVRRLGFDNQRDVVRRELAAARAAAAG
jgi:serine/threonine protein kinase